MRPSSEHAGVSTSKAEEFPNFLKSRLGLGQRIRVYHVSTHPSPCSPLFAAAPGRSEEATTITSHFLSISQLPDQPTGSPNDHSSEILVLGIEVPIFTSQDLTTIFVSKADSTGFLTRPAKSTRGHPSLAHIVITAFLEYLVKQQYQLCRGRLVLSLFARSQNQYLFPGSIENSTKHILDDRSLIKWWCRVLDPVARGASNDASCSVKAHVVVPGCDSGETKAFFPPSARSDPISNETWVNAYPVKLLLEDVSVPPRCLVPRLPDDPKARFLNDLDAQRDDNGNWRGIKTLDQFWEMMSYRQECSAGRLVGFVWVVFTPRLVSKKTVEDVNDESLLRNQQLEQLPRVSDAESKVKTGLTDTGQRMSPDKSTEVSTSIDPACDRVSTIRGTAVTTAAASADAETPTKCDMTDICQSRPDRIPTNESGRSTSAVAVTALTPRPPGRIVLTAEKYQALMDELLGLDFAGEFLAIGSTNTWRQEAQRLAETSDFGVDIEGLVPEHDAPSSTEVKRDTSINVLTNVRKKRKVDPAEAGIDPAVDKTPAVNVLATNLVRKKPKP